MRRALAILALATAAGGATAAGTGVVVAPHVEAPGTPLFHVHAPGAYRLPLFLDVLRVQCDVQEAVIDVEPLFDAAASLVLAVLAMVWPRLPRPTLRAIAELPDRPIARALWRTPLILGPPRPALRA